MLQLRDESKWDEESRFKIHVAGSKYLVVLSDREVHSVLVGGMLGLEYIKEDAIDEMREETLTA
jgi:hypothetical protein